MDDTIRPEHDLWLPPVVRAGGRRGWLAAAAAGAGLGAATLVVPALLSDADAFGFFAVTMGIVAGVYLGFALTDGRARILGIENLGVVVFGAVGILALVAGEAWFLVAGYLGHATWDALHPHPVETRMPWWYGPACIGWDAMYGIYILVRLV